MFVDRIKIKIRSGDGGDGCVSFHRAKYVVNGGPDGGDGGRGGNIIFVADPQMNTLLDFRYKRNYIAKNGENGKKNKMSGKAAEDMVITVPLGTIIKEVESGKVMADMVNIDENRLLLKGGKGGKGNQHFATSRRQAPRYAEKGRSGKEYEVILELKTIADVGIIGLPNVGKSTLLSMVTNANPKIANYHFTTLSPNLGVVRNTYGNDFVMADIPGLVEGASCGIGLGYEFLRHIERTKVLVHVVDAAGIETDPLVSLKTIEYELEKYNPKLLQNPRIIACNKMDIPEALQNFESIQKLYGKKHKVLPISATNNMGLNELINELFKQLRKYTQTVIFEEDFEEYLTINEAAAPFTITTPMENYYVVEGVSVEKMIGYTNVETEKGNAFFQKYLKEKGIIDGLCAAGIKEGDTVKIYDLEFEYFA